MKVHAKRLRRVSLLGSDLELVFLLFSPKVSGVDVTWLAVVESIIAGVESVETVVDSVVVVVVEF